MRIRTLSGDRGQLQELHWPPGAHERPTLATLARGAGLALQAGAASIWLVVRGSAELESQEGRFALGAGHWIYLDRESMPVVRSGSGALVLGLVLSAGLQARLQQSAYAPMYPGRGEAPPRARRGVLSLWRRLLRPGLHPADASVLLGRLLRALADLQDDCSALVERCPGRTLHRRRQVFARMQRVMLYLEGHPERALTTLQMADRASMSVWYFIRAFRAVYGETPQAASARLRLQRAARLLLEGRMAVGEVGAACGFENNCSFSRAFRAQFGVPPSIYRLHGGSVAAALANPVDMHGQAG
ncbi:AraC family transcriptional regulator [Pseudoxanthomonas sp. SGT-18]|uniref:helix-turn-helix domain-containing protein n=1 Tax=Pseudoxanthomonas sp. SGT-18 TaxID=2493087 RepID=UPI0013DE4BE5|nr:AraC family transcriptional regulator [Pseudoxanthomonas sp. SGT-18]